ncbi:MAG: FAD-dependent oxidoreductase, partial [Sciscionella sp.]
MNQPRRVAIVGAGLAGASAAATLRERDFDGEVLLFGQESEQPYELPALSKGILLGEAEEPDRVREQGFYAEHDISLHSATAVTEIDVAEALVLDSAGGSYAYDALVLATGSRPRTLT